MTRMPGTGRTPRLATRLALATGTAVALVIVAMGVLVSIGVIGRFDAYLDDARAQRYREVAAFASDLVRENGDLALKNKDLRRLAVVAGGGVTVRGPDGVMVASITDLPGIGQGRPADGSEPPQVSVPILVDGRAVGTLEIAPLAGIDDPASPAPSGFRETALAILVAAGVGAVLASMIVALFVARRLTRPIVELSAATRSVGAGDLSVRVPLAPDAETRELAVAFNEMAERLERSEELRRRAASELAHELAAPVTVLAGRLQALADGVIPPDPEALVAARDAAEEVRRLVGDLQDLAAAEGASIHREVETVELGPVAGRAAASMQALFDARDVALLSSVTAEGAAKVAVDERQLHRAIANLLTNAAMYTQAGGSAEISVAREGDRARVRVRDTGPGIDAADLPHVFERFYRGARTHGDAAGGPGGTGIGLTVARDLVEANGGLLAVEATTPTGTTFAIDLPVAR